METKRGIKGITPLVATIILAVVAVCLFIAIFFWIKSIQHESIVKFDNDIEQSCAYIQFSAVYSSNMLNVQNPGTVPIWKVEVYKKAGGSLIDIGSVTGPILSGTSASSSISCESGDQLKVYPILLGISKDTGSEKEYKCDKQAKTVNC